MKNELLQAAMNGMGDGANRMDAAGVITHSVLRLRREADGLEELLAIRHTLSPLAEEALWRLVVNLREP